jgi:hypothetical protein
MRTKLTIYLIVALFTVGCKSFDQPQLKGSFTLKIENVQSNDEVYAFVTKEWFNAFVRTLDYNSIPRYSNKWDCDDFANWFLVECKKYYAFANNLTKADSPAIGYLSFKRNSGSWHAIIFVIFEGFEIKYYDVESRQFIELSDIELKTIRNKRM